MCWSAQIFKRSWKFLVFMYLLTALLLLGIFSLSSLTSPALIPPSVEMLPEGPAKHELH